MGRFVNFVASHTDVFTGNGEVNFVETIIITMSIDFIAGFTVDSFAAVSCQSGDLLGRRCQESRVVDNSCGRAGTRSFVGWLVVRSETPVILVATSRTKRNEPGNEGISFCARTTLIFVLFLGKKMYEKKARPSQTRFGSFNFIHTNEHIPQTNPSTQQRR